MSSPPSVTCRPSPSRADVRSRAARRRWGHFGDKTELVADLAAWLDRSSSDRLGDVGNFGGKHDLFLGVRVTTPREDPSLPLPLPDLVSAGKSRSHGRGCGAT